MAAPWEKYKQQSAADGPWTRYAETKPDFKGVQTSAQTTQSGDPFETFNFQNRNSYDPAEFQRQQIERTGEAYRKLPAAARVAAGVGEPVDRLLRGSIQLLTGDTPESQAQEVQARQIADATVKSDFAGRAGRFGGEVALAAAPMSRIGALSTAGRYGASAAAGAGYAALQPTVEGESRAANAAEGGALGLVGQGVGDVLLTSGARAAQAIKPEVRALYEKAKAMGIRLTPAQLSDSEFLKRAAMMLDKLPFSGSSSRAAAQQRAGNKELLRLVGAEGDTVNAESFGRAMDAMGDRFDHVFADGMNYGRGFLRKLVELKREASSQMDDTAIRTINSLVERVRRQGQGGHLSGQTLQSLDQAARKAATGGGDRQQVAGAFRTALHDAFEDSASPKAREAWQALRRQYAIAKTVEPVVARYPEGPLPLQQLQGAINSSGRGRAARARGNDGELGLLATIGQRIKSPTSSGTAENLLASQALNPLAWPFVAGSALAGRLGNATLNGRGLAALMMREGRGQTRQALAPVARVAGVAAAPKATDHGPDKTRKRK